MKIAKVLLFYIFFCVTHLLVAQKQHQQNLATLDSLLNAQQLQNANTFVDTQIQALLDQKSYYLLTDYTYYKGKIIFELKNKTEAIKAIKQFSSVILNATDSLKVSRQLALETGSFYNFIGATETAKDYNLKALDITKNMPKASGSDLALIESNLGVFYSRLGDIPKATQYHKKALKSLESDSNSTPDRYYIAYNSLGGMMWYASKFDSAVYYYKNADKTLQSLEQTPWNTYYRSATVNNNIAAVYSIQGNMDAAIQAMQITVNNLSACLKEDISDIKKTQARTFLFQAIDNYAGLYKDIGDLEKAKQLIAYAYEQKQKHLNPNSPEIIKGKILLGQAYLSLKDYSKADIFLTEGIQAFKQNDNNYTYWLADGLYSKALLKFEIGDLESAKAHFEDSEHYYKVSFGDYYEKTYLDFIVNASNFYAHIGEKEKALAMAMEALEYIKVNQGAQTLLEYNQLINIADIYFKAEDYDNSLDYCNKAIELLSSDAFVKNSRLNTLQIEANTISSSILKIKMQLKRNTTADETFLKTQLVDIENVIRVLENKKSILSDNKSTAILVEDHIEVFNIAKQLNLDLYKRTKEELYLEKLLSYHESMIYHNIRHRLNAKSAELTASLPPDILEQEQQLKTQMNDFSDDATGFNTFLDYEKQWNVFVENLKLNYPNYYKLRYASISQSLQDITKKIPEHSTLIRYLFINTQLFAFVINDSKITLVEIDTKNLKENIQLLNENIELTAFPFQLQKELYNTLWLPLVNHINTKRVIVVPDKELFNLSFDLLTSELCQNLDDLKSNSLLSKHSISYNYSLFLVDKNSQPIGYDKNFIAFAPEFNEAMKSNYKIALKDSINLDQQYLKLLPQPFAKDLAEQYSRLFDGNSFLNENASKPIFTDNANEYKIIHIGTHAESNNVSPEFSRLIFAKDISDVDNSLYTYEIYNQNLSSNLAILTACETGKPSFQPGEGMISLAHAFNYAGSESILTSLWKIDEQSSSEIVALFYNKLSEGLPKDIALQEAKLSYLKTAKDRRLSPEYWAGLVLVGDTTPIEGLNMYQPIWLWLLISVALICTIVCYFQYKRKTTT